MTSSIWTGGTYDLRAFIHPRIAGSSERYSILTRNRPSSGVPTGSSTSEKSSRVTIPVRLAASLNWRFVSDGGVTGRAFHSLRGSPVAGREPGERVESPHHEKTDTASSPFSSLD